MSDISKKRNIWDEQVIGHYLSHTKFRKIFLNHRDEKKKKSIDKWQKKL